MKIKYLLCALMTLVSLNICAQKYNLDSLAGKLNLYGRSKTEDLLYVHFDKNVYSNNDNVWFTAYILKNQLSLDYYNTLSVCLINNKDSSIVIQGKYLIQNGFSYGSMIMPDSLPNGDYRFVAYTNILNDQKPQSEFIQPITVKSITKERFNVSLDVFKPNDPVTSEGKVLLKVRSDDLRFIPDAIVHYQIGSDKHPLIRGKAKTSVIGEYMIPFPAQKVSPEHSVLQVKVEKDGTTKYAKLKLPILGKTNYKINFYPEGGYLIQGLPNRVAWEAKDKDNRGLNITGLLFNGNKVIDTVKTNDIGVGSFTFTPEDGGEYYVKLKNERTEENFLLPLPLKEGVSVFLPKALSNDSLQVRISSRYSGPLRLMVHNYEENYLTASFNMKYNAVRTIILPLNDVPKGLKTITVLDSAWQPIAERLFFAHYNDSVQVKISTDKKEYKLRGQVSVKLNLRDTDGNPLAGIVSVSCVQDSRIQTSKQRDIVSYTYFYSDLGKVPVSLSDAHYNNRSYYENVLLVRGWRRYKWQEVLAVKPEKTQKITPVRYQFQVTDMGKSLRKPLAIVVLRDTLIEMFKTDNAGNFELQFKDLLVEQDKKVIVSVNSKDNLGYNIKFQDPFFKLNKNLASDNSYEDVLPFKSLIAETESRFSFSRTNKLKDVEIKGNENSYRISKTNQCGDYVCRYNILNCMNHRGEVTNRLPVAGQSYSVRMGTVVGTIIYKGCDENLIQKNVIAIKGVNLPKEFYFSDVKDLNEPILFPTIYWNYSLPVNKNGEAEFNFNTGDIPGKFRIIVQGISSRDLVYGEQSFMIHKP